MKKTIGLMGGIALCMLTISANAQTWDAKNNPTVDSITAKYKDKMIPARAPLTTEDIYPAIGKYESTVNTDVTALSVSLDETSKGVVWIDGLPQGRVKAMLRKSPATYKIPAQKTAEGKDVAEGTLIFDKESNTLNIVIGKPFNTENPANVFAAPAIGTVDEAAANTETEVKVKDGKTKTKTKVKKSEEPKAWTYTGTKLAKETVMN